MTMFSGTRNSKDLLLKLPDVTGSRTSKMAAVKAEAPITQLLDKLATPFQWLPHAFEVQELNGVLRILPDVSGSRESKLAAIKP
jgi:hypothetical protein